MPLVCSCDHCAMQAFLLAERRSLVGLISLHCAKQFAYMFKSKFILVRLTRTILRKKSQLSHVCAQQVQASSRCLTARPAASDLWKESLPFDHGTCKYGSPLILEPHCNVLKTGIWGPQLGPDLSSPLQSSPLGLYLWQIRTGKIEGLLFSWTCGLALKEVPFASCSTGMGIVQTSCKRNKLCLAS